MKICTMTEEKREPAAIANLILSSACNFGVIKKFPLRSSEELSAAASARVSGCPESPCFLMGLLHEFGEKKSVSCKPRKSVVFYF